MPKTTEPRRGGRSRVNGKPDRFKVALEDKNSALRKAIGVLRGVIAEGHGISAAELASRLRLPRQTVHRTVRALEEMRLVARAAGRDRYEIGPAPGC